ncbi:MAG: ribonuclease P protein component [Acidimicrobiaceae bacterium]|nr:ribonuclease P protein component [Acidimicrobiaceae bacterium]
MGRVSGRERHSALLKYGKRAHHGPISVVFLSDGSDIPSLAFSITRKVGSAVIRNKIRRQLREEFRRLYVLDPESIQPGSYLIRIKPEPWKTKNPQKILEEALKKL